MASHQAVPSVRGGSGLVFGLIANVALGLSLMKIRLGRTLVPSAGPVGRTSVPWPAVLAEKVSCRATGHGAWPSGGLEDGVVASACSRSLVLVNAK